MESAKLIEEVETVMEVAIEAIIEVGSEEIEKDTVEAKDLEEKNDKEDNWLVDNEIVLR